MSTSLLVIVEDRTTPLIGTGSRAHRHYGVHWWERGSALTKSESETRYRTRCEAAHHAELRTGVRPSYLDRKTQITSRIQRSRRERLMLMLIRGRALFVDGVCVYEGACRPETITVAAKLITATPPITRDTGQYN
jgi:hypothetical protein